MLFFLKQGWHLSHGKFGDLPSGGKREVREFFLHLLFPMCFQLKNNQFAKGIYSEVACSEFLQFQMPWICFKASRGVPSQGVKSHPFLWASGPPRTDTCPPHSLTFISCPPYIQPHSLPSYLLHLPSLRPVQLMFPLPGSRVSCRSTLNEALPCFI